MLFDEMSHMALVGNMLSAIGGTPVPAREDVAPRCPGSLPGGVRPELEIHLAENPTT
ncbi:ferritin-like domain-containing protein [Actinosynnema sp. CA-299493]